MIKALPQFVFVRQPEIERKEGWAIAGVLITDLPRGGELSEQDQRDIERLTQALVRAVMADPTTREADLWHGRAPPDAYDPSTATRAERRVHNRRMQRRSADACRQIDVRVSSQEMVLHQADLSTA
jgi:hypothetical protein